MGSGSVQRCPDARRHGAMRFLRDDDAQGKLQPEPLMVRIGATLPLAFAA